MRFTFLGTSAGEQFPGFWCRCETCEKARRLGGRNIRSNSCAHLGPDCMIDLNHWAIPQAYRFNVPIVETEFLLVTHAHEDHFSPHVLSWRGMNPVLTVPVPEEQRKEQIGPRFADLPVLHVYGSEYTCSRLQQNGQDPDLEAKRMMLHRVSHFQTFQAGNMACHTLKANHTVRPGELGINYIIERNGKTILYGLDSGWFFPETLDRIAEFKYDLVVIEGTFGFGADAAEHMNFEKVERAYQIFQEKRLLNDGAFFCISHLCPHWTPIHDEIAPMMAEKGITIAYDGMSVW